MNKDFCRFFSKLVILGDPHISENHSELWNDAVEDINRLNPDALLVLGDLTGGTGTGTPDTLRYACSVLDKINAPWFSIVGNHDLQAEMFDSDETALDATLKALGRDTPWFALDAEQLRVIGLSNTQWRRNGDAPNEIYLGPDQTAWFEAELGKHPDKPVLVLTHAPPITSGLITMAELHGGKGHNAFINQNHKPGEIMRIIQHNPNVVMWFSGHNHLGQHYRDAITVKTGVYFVHTGVVGRQSRDKYRHSRILEFSNNSFVIGTLDHVRRAVASDLACEVPFSLQALVANRKKLAGRTSIPVNPETMRQGLPDNAIGQDAVRFMFVSDTHVTAKIHPCQKRILEWTNQRMAAFDVDELILGGDITHRPQIAQAEAFLRLIAHPRKAITYIPGNNETTELPLDPGLYRNLTFVKNVARLETWPGHVFAIATTTRDQAAKAVAELAKQLPREGCALIFAHFPPLTAGEAIEELTTITGLSIEWVCGHHHSSKNTRYKNITVRVVAGLDPVKTRHVYPELLAGAWNGKKLEILRFFVPKTILKGPTLLKNPLGLAFRATPDEILETALAENAPAIQFKLPQPPDPNQPVPPALSEFRARFKHSIISLHLPNTDPEAITHTSRLFEPYLAWSKKLKIDDLTVHLPNVPVSQLYDEDGNFAGTDWAAECVNAFLALAEQAIGFGAGLSIENMYNKNAVEPDCEKLSCRPWHLLNFIEHLRNLLLEKGYSRADVEKVGILFDAGHAFRDAIVSKEHGLADWLSRIASCIRLCHIHQTLPVNGSMTNHQRISLLGPRINYAGLLPVIEEIVSGKIPLLIEVRDKTECIESLKTLRNY